MDSHGRFTAAGRRCYHALSAAKDQAESMAHAAPDCCACLTRHGCGGAASSCVANAARGALRTSCNSGACDDACAELSQEKLADSKAHSPKGSAK